MNPKVWYLFSLLVFLLIPASVWSAPEAVRFPLTVDYNLLRSLFHVQAFNKPGGKAIIGSATGEGCNDIELWAPEFSPEKSLLKINTNIKIKLGLKTFGKCLQFADWEGTLKILQRVWVDKNTQNLRFTTISSDVFGKDGKPAKVGEKIWNVIRTTIIPFFDDISINLSFPVNELKNVLPLLVSSETRPRLENWLNSFRLSDARVDNDAVRLELLMETEPLPKQKEAAPKPLSPQEVELFSRSWETWDSFLVYQIESLLGQPLTETEQGDLMETLLDTRQGFIRSLGENTLGNNLIREQFVGTWQRLATILRTHLVTQPSTSLLKYLSFFTASDALVTLDKLGPALGIDISREGLVRLAQLLSDKQAEPLLEYSYGVDPGLRNLLGFGPPLDTTGPAFDRQEIDFPDDQAEQTAQNNYLSSWRKVFLPLAFAVETKPADLGDLKQWIPSAKNIQPYIFQVKQVLDQAAQDTLAQKPLENKYLDFYRLLVLSTAWQESCWRQFINTQGKLRYLLSYNQSSIGLMQINERVWRGLYRLESLGWNIRYNARAGSEILNYYLSKYALKKMDPANPLDLDTLSRVVYAMYNGGPGEFRKLLKRKETNSFYDSDKLFWEKYTMAKEGQFDKVSVCILGK
ncbi:MAG: lytic transglycosylase domain-containing protein [Thermodesulfobacteriota bacterium]|nr:MAG: lytic transglycosylase domain-containing protein [Thermodesulfobacteriota bacterium]